VDSGKTKPPFLGWQPFGPTKNPVETVPGNLILVSIPGAEVLYLLQIEQNFSVSSNAPAGLLG
jgi:hypothetical protein